MSVLFLVDDLRMETRVAKESRVRWQGAFSIGGVGLDTLQENSDVHRLTVFPKATSDHVRVCGDNGYPPSASGVKERVQ